MAAAFVGELRRRGVLGALTAYGVIAAGGLQVCDIVFKAMDLPGWTLKAAVGFAAVGLVITAVVSWFYDLTRRGFVRTSGPPDRVLPPPTPPLPSGNTPARAGAATPEAIAPPVSAAAMEAVQSLSPGATLGHGRYRIDRELGSGGMGRVFAAVDTRLGRRVAIKVVTAAHDPGRVRRFEQEARAAGGLEHPNVVAVYDLGEQDGVPFLVTELLEGHTLRTMVSSGPLPAQQARGIALQLARGLAAAHQRGVVHRDLKPENLFVTNDGRLKILDFGLAKLVTPSEEVVASGRGLTVTGAIFGTPGYLSPEQARGEPAGAPSDVFSAGAVLYEVLTGRRAFPGTSLVESAHAALTQPPPPFPEGVPPSLAAVVLRSLQKIPGDRFQHGGELLGALEADATVTPAEMERLATVPAETKPMLRRRTAVGLAAAGLAIGAAVASAARVRHDAKTRESRQAERNARAALGIPGPPRPPAAPGAPGALPAGPETPEVPGFDGEELKRTIMKGMRAGRIAQLQGAYALARTGNRERAERLLRVAVENDPEDVYSRLQLFALLRRTGRAAEAERDIKQFAASMDDEDWPAPLAKVYAGMLRDEDAFAAAGEDGDRQARSRTTEAYFYLGLLHATSSPPDKDRARHFFQKAVEQKTNDIEVSFARHELDELQRKP